MQMKSIVVQDFEIRIKENYYSLTDIAKQFTDRKPNEIIREWLRNQDTMLYLQAWENFKKPKGGDISPLFQLEDMRRDRSITVNQYIERGGIGIFSKTGRNGGTFAHIDIALEFATWINPEFKVYFFSEWVNMKEKQLRLDSGEWFLDKIISNGIENANLAESLKQLRKDKQ